MDLEYTTALVLCTGHLTREEAARHAPDWPVSCWEHSEYGFFVYIGDANDGPEIDNPELWPGLMASIEFARSLDDDGRHMDDQVQWLRFDRDAGDPTDGLKHYEW